MKHKGLRLGALFCAAAMTITTSAQALSVEEAYDILRRSYVDRLPRAAKDAESLDEVRHALAQGGMAKNVKILSEKGRELTVLALDRAALLWNLRARFDVRREEDDFWVVRKARAARQADSPNN